MSHEQNIVFQDVNVMLRMTPHGYSLLIRMPTGEEMVVKGHAPWQAQQQQAQQHVQQQQAQQQQAQQQQEQQQPQQEQERPSHPINLDTPEVFDPSYVLKHLKCAKQHTSLIDQKYCFAQLLHYLYQHRESLEECAGMPRSILNKCNEIHKLFGHCRWNTSVDMDLALISEKLKTYLEQQGETHMPIKRQRCELHQ